MAKIDEEKIAELRQKIAIKQQAQTAKNLRLAGFVALLVLLFGSIFYHHVEKLDWVDSFYFSTITLSTVGYGDITPKTDLGKIFTIFYVMIGIGIIATFANLLLKNAMTKREIKEKNKENKL